MCTARNQDIYRTVDTVPCSSNVLVRPLQRLPPNNQRKVSRSRNSKSQGIAVVDNGSVMSSINVAKKSLVYNTNLGLATDEKRQKTDRTGRGVITFGEAMAG